jgi:predicted nucleic acid-binding protein
VNLYVIDASVAVKWLLPAGSEPLADEAFRLLRRYAEGGLRFTVPDLFWAESANILWKAVRQGRWTRAAAEEARATLMSISLATIPTLDLLEEAYSIAATFDRTIYDSLYVALAARSRAQLVTADERLANALAAHLPVKWLGSI